MQLKDGIYSLIVADALGVFYEFEKRGTSTCKDTVGFGTWNQKVGIWLNDTSMTLAAYRSVRDRTCTDLEDIHKSLEGWFYEGVFTASGETLDVGATTQGVISLGRGLGNFYSNGNESLTRTLPLAFIEATDQEIRDMSALAHNHETA